ncbi:SDR family oxidoreductase [Photobacterium swingsii]|uniref:SDR family oxidoreductase n=1 Tax=Photobacterium swingsii TaxID=680026 RepID=UPI00352C465E
MKKIALVTGANSGMGFATTRLLSENGYIVYAGVRRSEAATLMNETASALNLPIFPVHLDVTDNESIKLAINTIARKEGQLDVLVNNAGYGLVASVEDGTDEEFINQFDVNVFGVLRTCREVIPMMRQQNAGTIINISSFLGKMGLPLLTHYNATKYAVEGITDSLRYELHPFNIKVHTVAPGLFKTGFVKHGLSANSATLAESSPYASQASTLLPIVSDKVNNGPTPDAVAQSVLKVLLDQNAPARTPAGDDSTFFSNLADSLSQEAFEASVREQLGL